MRTTIDLPDDLFRRAKSEAALRGRKLKDLIEEGLRAVVDDPSHGEKTAAAAKRVSAHDLLKGLCGIIEDAPADLSTNPKYFEDFGR
ncbi:MAG TPA: hypothetical protein VGG57_01465 [Stellaceae bacterium]|jgi:hypothetical protein